MTRQSEGVVLPFDEASKRALAALASLGDFAVLYLGSSFAEFTALSERLPERWSLLPTGGRLNAAADAMRGAIIDLDAAVLKSGASRTWWDATHVGERNPLASTLMLNLARFAALHETLKHHDRCLVLCDDRALCRLLYGEIPRSGHRAGWATPGRGLPFTERLRAAGWVLRCVVRGLRVRLRGLVEVSQRRSILRRLRRRYALPHAHLAQADILFVSWLRADSEQPGAALPYDPYLPHLAETASNAGRRVAYLMRALPGVGDYRKLAQTALSCAVPVLFLEELVSMGAFVAAAAVSLLLPLRLQSVELAGEDITTLLHYEAWRELGSWDVVPAYGHRAACRRLASLGVRVSALIHPFEHQPWEKLLHAGVRRWLPGCRVIGVQHSPFAFGYLSFFASKREIENDLIPDRLLVPGEGYVGWFRNAGFPDSRLAVIGAPRYEQPRSAAHADGKGVLCCTGIDLAESIELAAKATLASRDLGRPLVANYHPTTDDVFRSNLRDAVRRVVGGDVSHVRYVDAPASTLLDDAAVVLYSTSASAFDALMANKPVIYVGRDVDLDLNKVPEELSVQCTAVDDLRAALRAVFASAGSRRINSGSALNQWIAPFNAAAFSALLSARAPTGRAA